MCRISFQDPAVGRWFVLPETFAPSYSRAIFRRHAKSSVRTQRWNITWYIPWRCKSKRSYFRRRRVFYLHARGIRLSSRISAAFSLCYSNFKWLPCCQAIWSDFQDSLLEDFNTHMRNEDAVQEGLREIDLKLQLHGKTNEQVNLPPAMHNTTELRRMKNSFLPADCKAYADMHEPKLTCKQHDVYYKILQSVSSRDGKAYMIDSREGTGK